METVLVFGAGVLAHAISLIAAQYAQWLLQKAMQGVAAGFDFLADIRDFARWLMNGLAGRLCDRPAYRARPGYDHDYDAGLYRN